MTFNCALFSFISNMLMINIIEYTDNSGEFGSLKGCYLDLIWTLLLLHPTGLFANKLL